jgi:TfoX/Sxy family transcriptional regulator of competence genes
MVTRKKRPMPKFTKPPESLVALFGRAIGAMRGVEPRRMFGYPAAFVNGNMFSCLFQSSMILRLSDADRAACASEFGAMLFEPMPGRPMREYVALPDELLRSPRLLEAWLRKSRGYAAALPPRTSGKKARSPAKKRR